MMNPFENADSTYKVLMNGEGQYSLWPAFIEVPAGWSIVHEQDSRQACLDYIEMHWNNMQPNQLITK
ncbi:MbtH family protein [Paenibacillus larvae subsp. pulvifaciens]|nr:MbtH family protein [Paenibacillus larvae]AQT86516.1 MbtH family protein [Paenibacillus larvae subsp. pulvifaciens]AQZ48176.1 MbtH family protein [Paenibacillus larvae subsp. pulvifaciens]MBH0343974.1 hypothetical protein [Paenibacillus larvae]MCY7518326.1 MbtH family protein [Paenibacillus larvae]MCY9500953.1 MbtH family protein [Paenibacillus larvae]